MKLVGSGQQKATHHLYRADGAITTGGSPQLVLGRAFSRSFLFFQNTSATTMSIEFGAGAATAVLTNGVVTSVTVTNAGLNFTKPPRLRFLGGGQPEVTSSHNPVSNVVNPSYVGLSQPNGPSPSNGATALATLSTGAIASITVTSGGSGYILPPYVQLLNSDLDPNGVSLPSATIGLHRRLGQWPPADLRHLSAGQELHGRRGKPALRQKHGRLGRRRARHVLLECDEHGDGRFRRHDDCAFRSDAGRPLAEIESIFVDLADGVVPYRSGWLSPCQRRRVSIRMDHARARNRRAGSNVQRPRPRSVLCSRLWSRHWDHHGFRPDVVGVGRAWRDHNLDGHAGLRPDASRMGAA